MERSEQSLWHRVSEIVDQALSLPPDERAAFLEATCDTNTIRSEVESLLHEIRQAEAHGFLDEPVGAHADALAREALGLDDDGTTPDLIGQEIGPYRIERELGRGGMGAVFLAKRADGQFEQQVALKLMRGDLVNRDDLMARLRRERQILADLQHEHVARLLDGGVDAKGRPYIAMEYVEGETIDRYCDRKRLGIETRLRLVKQVGEAVAAAHRRAVIHRDLKPSNILVWDQPVGGDGPTRSEPVAKLLDFGIAKLLELDEEDKASPEPITRTGMMVLTPEYAAPEQVRSGSITTATDVYQLGVVLYELLTGQRPFDEAAQDKQGRARLRAIEDAILGTEPLRPSTAVTRLDEGIARKTRNADTVTLTRRLRGDLDAICLKAMRKEPAERYRSVEAFLEDIQRYLEGWPVEARQGTTLYRARKYARRHWRALAIAATFVGLIVGGGILYTMQVAQERDRAQTESEKARQVTKFLISIFDSSSPYTSSDSPEELRVVDIIRAAENELVQSEPSNSEVYATLLHTLGRVNNRLSLYEEADSLLHKAHNIRQRVLPGSHPDLYESHMGLGHFYVDRGRYEEAHESVDHAVALSKANFGENSSEHASALALRATIYNEARSQGAEALRKAENAYRASIQIRKSLPNDHSLEIAKLQDGLGTSLIYQGRYAEADSVLNEALSLKRAKLAPGHWGISTTLNNLSGVHLEQHQYDQALPLLRESIRIRRNIVGEHPDVATALDNLGSVLLAIDSLDQAESVLDESLSMYQSTLGPEHNWNAYVLRNFSKIYWKRGNMKQYVDVLERALAIDMSAGFDETNWRVILDRIWLADGLIKQQRFQEAEDALSPLNDWFTESADTLPEAIESRKERIYNRFIDLYTDWGRTDQASQWRQRLEIAQSGA